MEPMPGNSAVAIRCGLNGALKEVIYDKLGLHSRLLPGKEFAAIIAPIHLRKATRFLQTVRANGSALDWELNVAMPEGVTPLFFSGCVAGLGVVIVGAKAPLADATQGKTVRYPLRDSGSAPGERKQRAVPKPAQLKARGKAARLDSLSNETAQSGNGTEANLLWLEIAAHDLRNPVSGILAATQFLIEDAGPILQAHHITLLRSIESSSQFMLRLLQDLSEIPALESSKLQFDFYLTDAGALVENAVLANRPLAASKRVNLELKVEKPAPTVFADQFKIGHALNTLLASVVRCSPADAKIEVRVSVRKDQAVITFRGEDTGRLRHDLKTLFHSQGKRSKSGMSEERATLTLGIAKRIVAGHRGTIQVHEEASEGSILTLALPIAEGTARNQARKPVHTRAQASSPR
jgi:signal transduction histidine kinase